VDHSWAAAADLLAIEGQQVLIAHSAEVVGIRAVSEEDAQAIPLEGAGLDDGCREWQAGVGLAELLDVDHSAGPEAVELLTELTFQVTEETGLGADEADLLADEEFSAGGEEGGLTKAPRHQVKHGSQVAGIGLAMAEVSLLAGELDLIGVEEGVLHARRSLTGKVGSVVVHEGTSPGLVVDAGRFMAEEDQQRGVLGDQSIDHLNELDEASLGRGETVRLHQFQTRSQGGGRPVDILADVQEDDQDAR
jgi:hypothetical protein